MRKAEYMGTCQVCFAIQKLPNERLSLHGYERPGDGYLHGNCQGSHSLPYEKSCEITKSIVKQLIEHRRKLDTDLEKFRTTDHERLIYKVEVASHYSGRNRIPEYEDAIVKKDEKEKFNYTDKKGKVHYLTIPSFNSLFEKIVYNFQRDIEYTLRDIKFFQEKVDSWVLRDFLPLNK